ncbi:MAG: orotidine-5'-phosphate decarboxylase [Candidatus Kapaibacteriales bacterium]
MTAKEKIEQKVKEKCHLLCVGLDTDLSKTPKSITNSVDGLLKFNIEVIEATKDITVAYKLNFAFYERYGHEGMKALKETIKAIPKDIHIVGDAKRGDIGNTSNAYADAIFNDFGCDSVTVSPYMGEDSVSPFLDFEGKMVFILALTSNPGSTDFQRLESEGKPLYTHVIEKSLNWDNPKSDIGFVVGATHPSELSGIRLIAPNSTLLIPGVGKQGGDSEAVLKANGGKPALINSSRAILYPWLTSDLDIEAQNNLKNNWKEAIRTSAIKTAEQLKI